MTRTWRTIILGAALAAAGCGGGDGASPPTTTTTVPAPEPGLYVSLGDSYAAGNEAGRGNTTNGFAYQVADLATEQGRPLELVNFGCGGATTESILHQVGCEAEALGPGAAPYDGQTQVEAAEAFLAENRDRVELITVSIGGNDVTACVAATDPIACVGDAVSGIRANVVPLVERLRAAAGDDVLIVGTTYPDVILGAWVSGDPAAQQLAQLSVVAFQDFINPALEESYASGGAVFVDVTAASGAYGSFDETVELEPYGEIPVPVAEVCQLTYFCDQQDIHANAAGYRLIAELVVDRLLA